MRHATCGLKNSNRPVASVAAGEAVAATAMATAAAGAAPGAARWADPRPGSRQMFGPDFVGGPGGRGGRRPRVRRGDVRSAILDVLATSDRSRSTATR